MPPANRPWEFLDSQGRFAGIPKECGRESVGARCTRTRTGAGTPAPAPVPVPAGASAGRRAGSPARGCAGARAPGRFHVPVHGRAGGRACRAAGRGCAPALEAWPPCGDGSTQVPASGSRRHLLLRGSLHCLKSSDVEPHERLGHTLVISATTGARAAAAPDAELTHAGAPDGIR